MKKSGHYSQHKILKQLNKWMDWLETPNEDFGGMPVCPFLAPERKTDKLLIDYYDYREKSIFQQIIDFDTDDKVKQFLYLFSNNVNLLFSSKQSLMLHVW